MSSSTIKKKPNRRKHLSDGTCYETHIYQTSNLITFRNTAIDELKTILKYMKGVISAYGFNHIFIEDIRIILIVFKSRMFPNNWAICITEPELIDIKYREEQAKTQYIYFCTCFLFF